MAKPKFTTIAALSEQTNIPVRTLRTLYHQRKISGIKAGHRTLLFDPEKVIGELSRFEIKAVV